MPASSSSAPNGAEGQQIRKKRKPQAPNAYTLFLKDHINDVKGANPHLTNPEIMSTLGANWKSLDLVLKQKYIDQADEGKRAFEKQLVATTGGDDDSSDDSNELPKKRRRKKRKPQAPNPYTLYLKDHIDDLKAANKHLTNPEIMSLMGSNWKALNETSRQKYLEKAEEGKKELQLQLAAAAAGNEDVSGPGRKRKRGGKKEKTRAPNAYTLFVKDQNSSLKVAYPDLPQSDIMKMLGTTWKSMSDQSKKKYVEQAEQQKAIFIAERNSAAPSPGKKRKANEVSVAIANDEDSKKRKKPKKDKKDKKDKKEKKKDKKDKKEKGKKGKET